jgi:hypothetical protein
MSHIRSISWRSIKCIVCEAALVPSYERLTRTSIAGRILIYGTKALALCSFMDFTGVLPLNYGRPELGRQRAKLADTFRP